MEHILFKCPFMQDFWYWVKNKLNWTSPIPQDIEGFLRGWLVKNRISIYEKLWNITPAIIMWEIWKERNRQIFQNLELSKITFFNKVEAAIIEFMNCHLRNTPKAEGTFSVWDENMRKN